MLDIFTAVDITSRRLKVRTLITTTIWAIVISIVVKSTNCLFLEIASCLNCYIVCNFSSNTGMFWITEHCISYIDLKINVVLFIDSFNKWINIMHVLFGTYSSLFTELFAIQLYIFFWAEHEVNYNALMFIDFIWWMMI